MRIHILTLSLAVAGLAAACSPAESAPAEPVEVPVIGAVAQSDEAPAASSQFAVEGMHCGSCANSIRTTVTAMDGVVGCELTYEDAVLTVHWAESADDAAVLAAVGDMGYEVAVLGEGATGDAATGEGADDEGDAPE